MRKNECQLYTEVAKRSIATTWDEIIDEWDVITIEYCEEPGACLCGHFPINELCTLRNHKTCQVIVVGNCCVKQFMGKSIPDEIFKAIKRIRKDNTKSINMGTLDYAKRNGLLAKEADYDFYANIMKKRKLTLRQETWKIDIELFKR